MTIKSIAADRSARFNAALARYGDEGETCIAKIIDLLADTRHWCDRHGHSFAELDRIAHRYYLVQLHAARRSS